MQKKAILFFFLMLFLSLNAQSIYNLPKTDSTAKEMKWRENIALDYSMPDYSVKKIDANVIGPRLTKLLTKLFEFYKQPIYNRMLAQIRATQADQLLLQYIEIDKIKLLNITKEGQTISIRFHLYTKDDKQGKLNDEIVLTFTDGLSADETTNNLFSEIGRLNNNEELNLIETE